MCAPLIACVGRFVSLALSLILAISLAVTLHSKGTSWLVDGPVSPLFACKSSLFHTGHLIDGDFCEVEMLPNSFAKKITESPLLIDECVSDGGTSVCGLDSSCGNSCISPEGERCPNSLFTEISGDQCTVDLVGNLPFQISCKNVATRPFCDSAFSVTSAKMLGIRGLFLAACLILLAWFVCEFILARVERRIRTERSTALSEQSLKVVTQQFRNELDRKWTAEALENRKCSAFAGSVSTRASSRSYSSAPGSTIAPSTIGSFSGSSAATCSRSPLYSRDPKRRFGCTAWLQKLQIWREFRQRQEYTFKPRAFLRSLALSLFFFAVLVSSVFAVFAVIPDVLLSGFGIIPSLENIVWLDFVIFADVILDVFLFLCATLCNNWPRRTEPPEIAGGKLFIAKTSKPDSPGSLPSRIDDSDDHQAQCASTDMASAQSDWDAVTAISRGDSKMSEISTVGLNDICLLIACHESTLTASKAAVFRHTIMHALAIFPPRQIFVCDNGNSLTPVDGTWKFTKDIHPEINYLYIPEGNKTFAFYWTNRYWIPFLISSGRCPSFKFALMIDDDVTLPDDFKIPADILSKDETVKAVHYPLSAVAPGRPLNTGLLLGCQDVEYKLAAAHKLFQARLGRTLSCHGAVSLWERKALDRVLFEHDTVFHGEDLYMGLSLLRFRDESKIISCPETVIPTFAPNTWSTLFRQRVKSWELTSHKKTFTYLIELLAPSSFTHWPSFALKPYVLQEFLTIALDWVRTFLLVTLLLRNWFGLVVMTGGFAGVLYFQLILHQAIFLRKRPDLRAGFKVVALFPIYRLGNMVFRMCALCQNVLVYAYDRKAMKIGQREDEVKDIPPCPPHPDVDWFTVWIAKPRKESVNGRSTTRTSFL